MSGDATAAAPGERFLCRLAELQDGAGKGFWFGSDVNRYGVFVLRRGDSVLAYENSCPHRGTPLDWQKDRFLDVTGRLILCATHGALFRIADGFCVSGPCAGARLTGVPIACRDGAIYLSGHARKSD
jgi:nitrite reductase/ring-hydroxylating ferredoxin subunit